MRNREAIAEVLGEWLPASGAVLEIASGTGEHAAYFAEAFADLEWQPTDIHPDALAPIRGWRAHRPLPNLREPVELDASSADWPLDAADAILSINMVHISPWAATLGLLDGAGRLLAPGAPLILYGPWLTKAVETAASNVEFDLDLRRRNPEWGLREVERFADEAARRGLVLVDQRAMPANNRMLLFRR
ncbi:MAG: class I SAM-dependent methyltransferase [Pseudomonadota bacterium]|nr:class I SAM-dependent methyltransferase [Pseudomonadota bacterium]